MKHINEDSIADFVRGKLNPVEHAEVESHLSECPECRQAKEFWKSVFALAQQESSLQPPADAVRIAKAFAIRPQVASKPRTLGLVFDSLLSPAAAGMRGEAAARQLLFACEEVSIDLRLEQQVERKKVFMVGQILHRATNQGVMGATVSLLISNKVVAETWTNQFGEFQLECPMGNELTLSIGGTGNYRMELPAKLN